MISSTGLSVTHLGGYAPALPTPFDGDDKIDLAAFERMCQLQVGAGATALVVAGTTGEAPTLSHGEQAELVSVAVDVAAGCVPVIAGTGSNSTGACDRIDAGRRSRRSRCSPVRRPLLQQADPGRAVRTFLCHRPIDEPADHSL
jgi:hypothetical protein